MADSNENRQSNNAPPTDGSGDGQTAAQGSPLMVSRQTAAQINYWGLSGIRQKFSYYLIIVN